MENEQYSLCWDNFHRNMSSGMHSLLENEDLVDVTLAIGGQFLKAHKMVLSICSPYFRRLFAINPHKHPIILMTDVTYPVMSDLLTFMYQGEVEVGQDNLEKFLKTAEALQIKGLTGDNNDRHPSPTRERPIKRPPPPDDHPRPPPYRKLMHPNKKSKPILMEPTPSVTLAPVDNHSLPSITPSSIVEVEHQPPPQHLIKQNILPEFVSDSVNLLRCKAEPVDNTLDQSENSYDHFGDDTADDTMGDDKHYFSSLEEEEPQAGTSADGMGDGQVLEDIQVPRDTRVNYYKGKRKPEMPRYIVDGFVFHVNIIKGNPPMTYLRCLEYKRLGCHARAVIPFNGTINDIQLKKSHNHAPDYSAEEKIVFLRELKDIMSKNDLITAKEAYDMLSPLYPNAASESPFKSIKGKMNRWKRLSDVEPAQSKVETQILMDD